MPLRVFILALLGAAAFSQGARRPELRVEGHHAFSARRIEALIGVPEATQDWRGPDWEAWAEDAASLLEEAYRDDGYFDVRVVVQPPSAAAVPEERPRLGVRVLEGPRYRFGEVGVRLPEGNFPVHKTGGLKCRPGRFFDKSFLYSDRRTLLKFYGDAGFLKAQAAESLFFDTARKAVEVSFQVEPGRALVFDTLMLHVQREGDTTGLGGKTSTRLLRGLFSLRPGDTLSLRKITGYERKLKSTRAFNFVRIRDSSLPDAGRRGALTLHAEEKIPGELEASGFWENLYGLGGSLGWSHLNMGGHLQEGQFSLTFAQRKQSLFLGYGAPLLFGTSVRFDNNFTLNWFQDQGPVLNEGWFEGNFEVFNESKLSRQLLPWMRGVSGTELVGKSTLADSGRQRDFALNYVNSAFLERLDNPVNPSRGGRLALIWGNGGSILEKGDFSLFQNRHNWLETKNAAYLPFGGAVLLALRLDGGRFYGRGGINSERFYLGGPRNVRSEDWRRVCPGKVNAVCVDDIEPAYFLGSAELRLQPFRPSWVSQEGGLRHLLGLQIVPFADYGNIWEIGKNLTPEGQGRAVGLGLRYVFLALFNIRLDYAWDYRTGWDPREAGRKRLILDLSQAF